MMMCPLEKRVLAILEAAGIIYTRPERDPQDPTNLDFYLPAFNLYIEVKQWHSDRISEQLAKVPTKSNALVLMGPNSVRAFSALVEAINTSAAIEKLERKDRGR